MADTTIDQQFVEFIVKSLVSKPDEVKVERSIDEKGVLLELTVAPDDLGRVIGKRGNTAQSLRTLLRALGTKNDARYNLKIVDVNGGAPQSRDSSSDDTSAQSDADAPAEESKEEGASRWAHLASKSDDESNEEEKTDEEEESSTDDSSVVEKTRKELEDLADLNI